MFNKSRRKIILSIMGSLALLFVVTLSVIMLASYREIRMQNNRMLERYAELYSLDGPSGSQEGPGNMPDGQNPGMPGDWDGHGREPKGDPRMDERTDYRLATFYAVAIQDDGTVRAVDTGEKAISSEEELTALAVKLLAEGRTAGRTGNLAYLIIRKNGYSLVAFMDNTVTESSLSMLLRNVLIIGGAAMIALFFISLVLANRIIRPLEENDRQQKQFISDASHELKTPVAVIGVNAEMLSRELEENEWLSNIRYENERMGELVKQLLDLSRAENAEIPSEQVDFSRVVTGETLAFDSLAFDRGKTILSDIEEGIRVTGSQTQLTQLVSVLLDNAIRHSTGNEIEVSLKTQGHAHVLNVINEGEEIPPEKLAHLFDRFYRVDEARNSDGQHYGLGLAIAKAVAEKHGGQIGVTCRDGKVCFTVSLPKK